MSFRTIVLVTIPAAPRSNHSDRSSGSPASHIAGPAPVIRAFSAVPNSGSVSFAETPFLVATLILRTCFYPIRIAIGRISGHSRQMAKVYRLQRCVCSFREQTQNSSLLQVGHLQKIKSHRQIFTKASRRLTVDSAERRARLGAVLRLVSTDTRSRIEDFTRL